MGTSSRLAGFSAFSTFLCATLVLMLAPASALQNDKAGQPQPADNYFPSSTVAFLQISQPAQLVDALLDHPARQKIEQMEPYRQAVASNQMLQLLLAVGMLESQIDQKWPEALKSLTRHGIQLGFDARTEGAIILLRADDEAKLKQVVGTILGWAKSEAERKGDPQPYQIDNYRDFKVATFDGGLIARWKTWFLISNKKQLAKAVADNLLDGPADSLADNDWFQQATQLLPSADAWAAVNLAAIRDAGSAKELFLGKTDNPAVELVFGGILDAMQDAPFAVAGVDLERNLRLQTAIPFSAEQTAKSREFFFGDDYRGQAPRPLMPEDLVANLIAHRDVAAWWLSKEDLFEENVIAQLSQADSQLSTLFAGLDFGQEVLGAVKPGVQIVATRQNYEAGYQPDMKLPAFALVARLKEPQHSQRQFKLAFQNLIGILNINLSMQGQPQLELETQKSESGSLSSALYVVQEDDERGLLLYNFSPAIAFEGEYFIVSSTRALASELARLATNADPQSAVDSNTRLTLEVQPLSQVLGENREALIAQNMIEEGRDRQSAETHVELLLSLIDMLKRGELDFQIKPDRMFVNLELTVGAEATVDAD